MLRFLAGAVKDRPDGLREMRGRLEKQRRLSYSRLAAKEHQRPGHDTTAEDPIELSDPGRDALGHDRVDLRVELRPGRCRKAVARPAAGSRGCALGQLTFLDQRVPGAALGAPSKPLGGLRAAFLAGENRLSLHTLFVCAPRAGTGAHTESFRSPRRSRAPR